MINKVIVILQIESYRSDFEAERKDRESAHSKLADLERELAREKNRIDAERAAYQKHFGELQQGSKEKAASYGELEKQMEDVEKLKADSAKHKVETDKHSLELQAKVCQVQQYKKENDCLKAQVVGFFVYTCTYLHACVSSKVHDVIICLR